MKLIKGQQATDVDEIINNLSNYVVMGNSPVLELNYRKNGFSLVDKNARRFVHCTVDVTGEGIMLEFGNLNMDMEECIMCPLKSIQKERAVIFIHKYFTINNDRLFEVPAHCGAEPYLAYRNNGKLIRYKIRSE